MYNAKYIIPGVLIAVVAFTSPFWLNLGGKTYVYPEVALPTGRRQGQVHRVQGMDACRTHGPAEHLAR